LTLVYFYVLLFFQLPSSNFSDFQILSSEYKTHLSLPCSQFQLIKKVASFSHVSLLYLTLPEVSAMINVNSPLFSSLLSLIQTKDIFFQSFLLFLSHFLVLQEGSRILVLPRLPTAKCSHYYEYLSLKEVRTSVNLPSMDTVK
jgi:hypothetical protein